MTTINTDRIPKQVPSDGQEFLREDATNIIADAMADVGNALKDIDADRTAPQRNGGIIDGVELTTILGDNDSIVVSPGTIYDAYMGRIDEDSITTISIAAEMAAVPPRIPVGTTSGYVVARYSVINDTTTEATHPFSGASFYKRKKFKKGADDTKFFELTDTIPARLVGNRIVYIGYWELDAGTLKLFGRASLAVASGGDTLTIYPYYPIAGATPTVQERRGDVGNKYWVRFRKEIGAAVSVTESSGVAGAQYLDVTIPTDSAGVVTATFNDVLTAINSGFNFQATFTGLATNLFAGAAYIDTYTALSGGNSYRQYYQAKAGSASLTPEQPDRLMPSDEYTKHLMSKGRAPVTSNNPHGMDAEDIPGYSDSWRDHQRREHNRERSGISKGSGIGWLALTGAGTNTVVSAAGASTDRAIVNGHAVTGGTAYSFTQASTAAFEPYTSEFVLTQSGAVMKRDIAIWNTGAANIAPAASPNEALFSITGKHPDLTGTDTLTLISTGAAYQMTLGTVGTTSGPAVDVTLDTTEYTLYRKDGKWVTVYHEAGFAFLGAGTYSNTIDFVASQQNDTTLTIGVAAWRNGALGRLWAHLSDQRIYGTLSVEHDAYAQSADTLDYGCRYSGDTLLAYAPGLPAFIQELRPFEVDYRGRTYRFDSVPIGSIGGVAIDTTAGVHNFLAVRFDAANVPSVINLGATLWGVIVKETDVILGDLVHDALGHPSDTASTFFQMTGEKGYVGTHIRVSSDTTQGWDIDDALKFMHCVCLDANVKANTVFLLELLSNVATAGGGAAYTVGRLMIRGNGYYITGNTGITVTTLLTDNILLSSNFHFVQPAVAVTTCAMTRTFTTGAYPDHFLYTAATVASIEAVRCGFGQNGNMATFYSDAAAASIIITDSKWYETTVLTSLVTTNATSAPGHNIKISGCILSSVGTIINLAGRYNSLEMSRNTWAHSATVPPISYSGDAGSLALRLYNNSFAWTSTDPGASPNFITIADGGAGNFDLSMRLIGNEFNLAYGVGATDPALLRISAGPAAYIGTSGIMFGNNEYRVTALGCTGANQWKCLDDDTGLDLGATYEASNETVYLIGNTDGATHSLGVAGCDSYRVDGLAFVVEDQTQARYLTVTGTGYVVDLAHISFPCVKFTIGGDVASKHWVTGTGRTVSIHNIVNAAADSWNAVDAIGTGNDSSLQVRDVSGMVSSSGALGHCTVGAADLRCNAMVSGCNLYDPDVDAVVVVSGMTTPHDASTTGFSVGNTQKRGNPATATGFDVSSNHYVA